MLTKVVEVTNDGFNWGKFLLIKFTEEEWAWKSRMDPGAPLLRTLGWSPDCIWVLDLQTGEGAYFRPGGLASADLDKHKIWVCPMYEPFLSWLYKQDLSDITQLPPILNLKNAPGAMWGYRRPGIGARKPSGKRQEQVGKKERRVRTVRQRQGADVPPPNPEGDARQASVPEEVHQEGDAD